MSENADDGYYLYEEFLSSKPLLVLDWTDTETEAKGTLVINSLRGGAAGGGTRMRPGGNRQEAAFLAKTMELKFQITGPPIGGAKSVIDFDPSDPRKDAVLRRWFTAIRPVLKEVYGTGGDLGVDEVRDVIPITRELGLGHPQEGIVRGHGNPTASLHSEIIGRLNSGVSLPVKMFDFPNGKFAIADMITGYGLARSVYYLYASAGHDLKGKRVLLQGFGAVGGSAAYYLSKEGAKVVGILTKSSGSDGKFRWVVDPTGLDVNDLLLRRDGTQLSTDASCGLDPTEFWQSRADIFVPAAESHAVTMSTLDNLKDADVSVIACGANNPFADTVSSLFEVQRAADARFEVVPDLIGSGGMARTFAYLMQPGACITSKAIFADVDRMARGAIGELRADSTERRGLIARTLRMVISRLRGTRNGSPLFKYAA